MQLAALRVDYQTKARPIIDELVKIELAKPRPLGMVILDDATNVTQEMWQRWAGQHFTGVTPETKRGPSEAGER